MNAPDSPRSSPRPRAGRVRGRAWWGRFLLGFLTVYTVSIPTRVLVGARARPSSEVTAPADVALVPGAAVWHTRPSPVFAARLDAAADLYRRGLVRLIVTTGGQAEGDRVAEAESAVRYLTVRRGLPPSALRLESRSRTTSTNARNAFYVVPRGARVYVVTDPYHVARATQLARRAGLDAHPVPISGTRYRGRETRRRMFVRECALLVVADVTGK